MGTCPYCGKEVESGKFICERCSDSSSNPVVSLEPELSLSSLPTTSLSENIASQSVIELDNVPNLDGSTIGTSSGLEKDLAYKPFLVENKSDVPISPAKFTPEKEAPKPQVVEKTLPVESKPSKKEKNKKKEAKKSKSKSKSKTVKESTSLPRSSKSSQSIEKLPKSSKDTSKSANEENSLFLPELYEQSTKSKEEKQYAPTFPIDEGPSYFTEAQRQYMRETSQSVPYSSAAYTSAQNQFINESKVEKRLETLTERELGNIVIHSDFQILNMKSEQNKKFYGIVIAAALIFVFPFMSSGFLGFVFSLFVLLIVVSLSKTMIDSLVNTNWNKYASWVYERAKPRKQEFKLSFSTAYLIDYLNLVDRDSDGSNAKLGMKLKVRKHTTALDAVQSLYNSSSTKNMFEGKLYVLDEVEPLVYIAEIDDVRFWCEPVS